MKGKFISLLLLLFFLCKAVISFAENDTDQYEMPGSKRVTDPAVFQTMISSAINLIDEDPRRGLIYIDKALIIADQNGEYKQLVKALIVKASIQHQIGRTEQAFQSLMAASDECESKNDDKLLSEVYTKKADIYAFNNDIEKATQYYLKAVELVKKIADKKLLGIYYTKLGEMHTTNGNFKKSRDFYNKALMVQQESGDKLVLAKLYLDIGRIDQLEGNLLQSEKNLKMARTIYESISNQQGITEALLALGELLKVQKEYDLAIAYFEQAEKIATKITSKRNLLKVYTSLGELFREQNNYEKASIYLQKSLIVAKENGLHLEHAQAMYNIAELARIQSFFGEAKKVYLVTLREYELIENHEGMAKVYLSLSQLYFSQLNMVESESSALKALSLSQQAHLHTITKATYEVLYRIYASKKEYKKAYEYEHMYMRIKDSLFNLENAKLIANFKVMLETTKKDNEILELSRHKEDQATQISKQKGFLYTMGGGILLIAFLLIMNFRSNLQKQKINNKLEALNKELNKLSLVASETDNGVLLFDAKSNLEWVNNGYVRMHGYSIEEVMSKGKKLDEISSNPEINYLVKISVSKMLPITYEVENVTKDGKKIWVQSTVNPIIDKDGKLFKLVVVDSDITALKRAKDQLELKNEQITDSIEYAKSIQDSILIPEETFKKPFNDAFVFFAPKDIVSGDFYYRRVLSDNRILVAAVDCTGHGVPGAFMALMAHNMLDNLVRYSTVTTASKLLEALNNEILKSMHQSSEHEIIKHGMDLSVAIIDSVKSTINFSGAHNALYFIPKASSELIEHKADKQTLGIQRNIVFNDVNISYAEDDQFYLFTDGFADQTGGETKKKFFYKPFKEMIFKYSDKPLTDQKDSIAKTLANWKEEGNTSQIDDVLIIGVKL